MNGPLEGSRRGRGGCFSTGIKGLEGGSEGLKGKGKEKKGKKLIEYKDRKGSHL